MNNLKKTNDKEYVIITDIGSCDIDDMLALILATQLKLDLKGVIGTHNYPMKKAKMCKLVLKEMNMEDVPVYCGRGVEFSEEYNEQSKDAFKHSNSLWPKTFGKPKGTFKQPVDDDLSLHEEKGKEKEWFPNFMKGYTDTYTKEEFDALKIEDESAHYFLTDLLKDFDEDDKLQVICLGPPHDLELIPTELYNRMDIHMMGGGLVEFDKLNINVKTAGYNWGICPEIVRNILKKVEESKTFIRLITSGVVKRKEMYLGSEYYEKLLKLVKENTNSKFITGLMRDWINCNQKKNNRNELDIHKNMCDPLTVYAALYPENFKGVYVLTDIQNESEYIHYGLMSTDPDKNIIKMTCQTREYAPLNTFLITDFNTEEIKKEIIDKIDQGIRLTL